MFRKAPDSCIIMTHMTLFTIYDTTFTYPYFWLAVHMLFPNTVGAVDWSCLVQCKQWSHLLKKDHLALQKNYIIWKKTNTISTQVCYGIQQQHEPGGALLRRSHDSWRCISSPVYTIQPIQNKPMYLLQVQYWHPAQVLQLSVISDVSLSVISDVTNAVRTLS